MHVKRKISSAKNTVYQDLKEHDSHSGAVSMFEVICREIKIMLVDTWVLGLTLEVCLIYFLGMAVLSNWQNNKAISVGLVLLGIFAFVKTIMLLYVSNPFFCIAMVIVGLCMLWLFR